MKTSKHGIVAVKHFFYDNHVLFGEKLLRK